MSYANADPSYEAPRLTPAVQGIIAVNVGIAFLQLAGIWRPEDLQALLGFQMRDLQGAWWKALTYMFAHGGLLHLAGTMYMLWLFGPRLEQAWGTRGFLRFYVVCGIGGWLAHAVFVRDGLLLGASAAVYGVMFAYARQWRDEEISFFGVAPVKVRWLVAGFVAVDVTLGLWNAYGIAPADPALVAGAGAAAADVATTSMAHLAHLGGIATAWLYLKTPSQQSLDRLRQRINQVPDIPDEPPRAVPRQAPRPRERGSEADEVVAKSNAMVARPVTPKPVPRPPVAPVAAGSELDQLLDKISAQGMDSLTSEERQRLEEAAKRLKGA